jgi:hypothetical protein
MWYETLLNYLTQESTYTGLVAILTAFGITLYPELSQAIITCALGVFGLIKVVVNERKAKK